jgi:2-methylcitrate dehydratase PrpD
MYGMYALQESARQMRGTAPAQIPAFVTVQTIDGRRFECHVTQSRGTMARPMSDAELEAKFRSLAEYGAPTLDAQRLIAVIWAIEDEHDVGSTVKMTVR